MRQLWGQNELSWPGQREAHLIFLQHFILLQRLHRVNLACVGFLDESDLSPQLVFIQNWILHETYLSKCALANDFDCSEVIQAQARPSQPQEC